MKRQPGFLNVVESGEVNSILAIPVSDVEVKKVACPHRFTRSQIRNFVNGEMGELEAAVLMSMINHNPYCEEEARRIAQSEGIEDDFIDRMGW